MTERRSLFDYEDIAGPIAVRQLQQLARELKGASVVHVNSTRLGGGVAEILNWLIPLKRNLGIDASWEIVEGNEPFFHTTKAFHNGLQGSPVSLPPSLLDSYESTLEENAERLRPVLEAADFVFIHDPQPARLLNLCPGRRGRWIWRCHIDASHPHRHVWKYLREQVRGFDASIFSMADFAQPLPHPQFLISPSIDPLAQKNIDLSEEEVRSVGQRFGIRDNVPVITQISRFDRFKDPLGVIKAFRILQESIDADLVLAGGGATDDPEGQAILEEVREAAEAHPRIHVLLLPSDDYRTINALQRLSTIILQKSLQEGFGLTVTEAMWKGKPVIGGNVGGIRLQVYNYHTGFLVDTPEGAALRMREILRRPEKLNSMAQTAQTFVRENFLLTRHLREYLTLMLALREGMTDHLFTG
ncbi:MAG: glycosyltransferase [Desulfuromonadales bacterium]